MQQQPKEQVGVKGGEQRRCTEKKVYSRNTF